MSFVLPEPLQAGYGPLRPELPDAVPPVFEAVIVPHRSLGRRGSLLLVSAIGLCSAGIALRFWFIGAWPVMAFSGVEVVLVVSLLAMNFRHARAHELITLNPAEITVVQTDHRGRRQSFSLPSAWLQVTLETPDDRGCRLLLRSHGRGREVGALLHTPEKQSLFEALRDALHRLRQPNFDNGPHFDNEPLRDG